MSASPGDDAPVPSFMQLIDGILTEIVKYQCGICLDTFSIGSPSRLPTFCLTEAVLGSQHKCQWLTGNQEDRNSAVEEEVQHSVQNDDVTSSEKEAQENIRYSDGE